jgi:hypothetical protein
MGIQFPPNSVVAGAVVTATQATSVISASLAVADPLRLSGTIYNFTNKPIGISFGTAAATLAQPSKIVPANGNIDIYDNYTGAIQVIGTNGATGNIQIDTVSSV